MKSIYERALGSDFMRLHPQIQRRFGFSSTNAVASIGTGVMDRVWHGPAYTLPFLYLATWRRIMFPEQGEDVPFTIENYAYADGFGRETVTWVRTFDARHRRRYGKQTSPRTRVDGLGQTRVRNGHDRGGGILPCADTVIAHLVSAAGRLRTSHIGEHEAGT